MSRHNIELYVTLIDTNTGYAMFISVLVEKKGN